MFFKSPMARGIVVSYLLVVTDACGLIVLLILFRSREDKLYQIRNFLDAFNDNLVNALTPGKHLCVDESMNQWLGWGMPNLKKVPRKPHSVGQEFKTVAYTKTYCIVRLDITGNDMPKKFDDQHPKLLQLFAVRLSHGSTRDGLSSLASGLVHLRWSMS